MAQRPIIIKCLIVDLVNYFRLQLPGFLLVVKNLIEEIILRIVDRFREVCP